MANRFAHLIPKQTPQAQGQEQSPPPRKNRFAHLIPAKPQQDLGPQSVNIADKTDIGGPSKAQQIFGNPYSPMMQGMTLGAMDEIQAGGTAPIESAVNYFTSQGPTSIGENYAQLKAKMATQKAAYERDNPKKAVAGELAGSLMLGGFGSKFIAGGKTILKAAGRSALVGSGVGSAQGFAGTDGNIDDRGKAAVVGAATGATIGAILPPVFAGSKALIKGLTAPVRSLANKETFAAQKVAQALERDGMTPTRVANRLVSNSAIKGDLAVADVAGPNTAALLRASSNVPSKSRRGLITQIENRQASQLDRLQGDIGKSLGDPRKFYATTEQFVASRKSAAKPLFERAFQTPTPYTVDLENVLKRPLTGQLVERARIAAANRGEKFKNIFIQQQPNGTVSAKRVIDTEGLHRVKMTIDEMITGLKRGQPTGLDNVNLRDLTILKKDLMSAIENGPYKVALARYSGDSAMVNALDDGFENGLKMDPEKISETLRGLSFSERKLWQMGFARSISDSLRDAGRKGANRADILDSPKYMQRLIAAVPDKASRRELQRAINLEQRMARTRNAVQGNSTTAKQLAEGQEAGVDAQNAIDTLHGAKQLVRGDVIGAAMSVLSRAKNTATGLRPEVADQIIKLLTARTPSSLQQAQHLINVQTSKMARTGNRAALLGDLRAISAGLLSGRVGEASATPR
jgi:hypothetical protein